MNLNEYLKEYLLECKIRNLSHQTIVNKQIQLNVVTNYLKDELGVTKLEKIKKDQGERKSMKKRKYLALLLAAGMIVQTALSTGGVVQVQAAEDTYVKTDELTDNDTAAPKKDKTIPSKNQYEYQKQELAAFCHFGMNTYTNREWGDGTETPQIFNPTEFVADQWVSAAQNAGMKGVILTCKHHDGFCLWPTRYTSHSVVSSPWKNGRGDVVWEVSEACRRYGMKFGIYLSPWDRNKPCYGSGKEYDDYYLAQLTELLTGYGDIFSVWLDGACGEGPNGKKQIYDWKRYYECVRKYQPDACICVCGPDIRWCGNEAGDVRKSEWSVVPARTALAESVQERSQQTDDKEFRMRRITSDMEDLGSRRALEGETNLIWYPAEVNTSIRPGWFYHPEEDDQVKSLEELIYIYIGAVGGNATFLLNIPPMPNGLLHENDVKRLEEFGSWKKKSFTHNLMSTAHIFSENEDPTHPVSDLTDDTSETWFQPESSELPVEITICLDGSYNLGYLVLKEAVCYSQRVEKFEIFVKEGEIWNSIYTGTVIGYKKIISVKGQKAQKVKIVLHDFRVLPLLSFVGIYPESL